MRSYLDDISDFHTKFELPPAPMVGEFIHEMYEFRQRFLIEELIELQTAWHDRNLVNYLDALVDLDYVGIGTFYLLKGHSDRSLLKTPTEPGMTPRFPGPLMFMTVVNQFSSTLARFFTGLETRPTSMAPYEPLRMLHLHVVEHSIEHGLNFRKAWDRVHEVNMQKQRVKNKDDSLRKSQYDVVKPPGWKPADLSDLV